MARPIAPRRGQVVWIDAKLSAAVGGAEGPEVARRVQDIVRRAVGTGLLDACRAAYPGAAWEQSGECASLTTPTVRILLMWRAGGILPMAVGHSSARVAPQPTAADAVERVVAALPPDVAEGVRAALYPDGAQIPVYPDEVRDG